jgi:hypothetical protein
MEVRVRLTPQIKALCVAACVAVLTALVGVPAGAATQDDAGSGGDAGDAFSTATPVTPRGAYTGRLDVGAGDRHDYYRSHLDEGSSISVIVEFRDLLTDPVTLLDPNGVPLDAGAHVGTLGVTASAAFTSDPRQRLTVHRAPVAGEYRLHLQAEHLEATTYTLCFMNCEEPRTAPIDLIFGGSLRSTDTRVLLVPPAHGDLGNPFGPTVLDYIDATLRGMRRWVAAMDEFAADHPEYAYLREITVDIEIFDGVTPVDPSGYDVVIGYVAAGPVFRGVASDTGADDILRWAGLDDPPFSGRVIALSLFGTSPRAGQVSWDFPEVNDLETVTMHEFGHTFGLGHTLWWDPVLGPDLMNSPATFVYGDGFAAGDGGERTPKGCLSSINLYGMAVLYRWIPGGTWVGSGGSVPLPAQIPYELYC